MKKTLLSTALVAVMATAGLAPQSVRAATNNPVSNGATDGTITITGQVIAQTCKVDGKSAGTADAKTVFLPDVLTSQLATLGATAGEKPFSIAVTGCDASLSSVRTYFTGTNIDSTNGRLNTATGNAAGVQVQLINGDGSIIALNGADAAQNSKVVTLTSGAATLDYKARYYANAATVGAGAVSTNVAFTMIYQ